MSSAGPLFTAAELDADAVPPELDRPEDAELDR